MFEKSKVFDSRIVTKSPSPNFAACQETELLDLFSGDRNAGVFRLGLVKHIRTYPRTKTSSRLAQEH